MSATAPTRIRIVVVDDDAIVRRLLTDELNTDPELHVIGACADGEQAIALIAAKLPEVVLMDLQMPGMSGFAAIRQIREAGLPTRVIALTNLDDEITVARVLAAGGVGCLVKTAATESLVSAIKLVARHGLAVLPESSVRSLRGHLEAAASFSLSERQLRILKQLADGATGREIIAAEHISQTTLKTDQRAIERELGVKGRANLARRAEQLGLS